jgi:sulfate adenylyltransferase subunit 1
LTDGLKSEREQGITIDVAYRYFSTPKRKFIIADTPGHIQYTRNMVTGASTANLAIILVDARHGIIEQTKRHALIASLLGIPHVVICINKMDLVDYDQKEFERVRTEFEKFSTRINIKDVRYIPISALFGDNVVDRSAKMPWYQGPTLMYLLETIHISNDNNHIDARFPVQTVIRPHSNDYHDYRGYAGRVAGGVFKVGDEIVALPSGFSSKITSIELDGEQLEEAYAPMSVSMTLADNIDIGRGDMIAKKNNVPRQEQDLDAMICWMDDRKPLQLKGKYAIKHTTKEVRCVIQEIVYKMDINTLHKLEDDKNIELNDIGRIRLRTTSPLLYDAYSKNRFTGSFILIDEATNITVGAGMLIK